MLARGDRPFPFQDDEIRTRDPIKEPRNIDGVRQFDKEEHYQRECDPEKDQHSPSSLALCHVSSPSRKLRGSPHFLTVSRQSGSPPCPQP